MTTPVSPFHDPDELPPDTRLLDGRVVIDVRVGRGGAATVYAGTTSDGMDVALKVMSAAYAEVASSRQRFRNEVMLAQHLAGHPRIVTPLEHGEVPELGNRPYIMMPLVKGRSLLLLVGRRPVVEAVALVRDLAQVVADVHARGIIHRDIKPSNVIVADEGRRRVPYLLDFGLAYSDGAGDAPVTAGLTAAHEVPGTKHYMAPEQILGAAPDPRFDVYALGVTLYEMLTGFVPLHELSPAEAARVKCDPAGPPLTIAGKAAGLPPELVRVVDAALVREPERRTGSVRELVVQLGDVLERMERRGTTPLVVIRGSGESEGRPEDERPTTPEGGVVRALEAVAGTTAGGRGAGKKISARWGVVAVVVLTLGVGAMSTLRRPGEAEPAGREDGADGVVGAPGLAASGAAILDVGFAEAETSGAEPDPRPALGSRAPLEPTHAPPRLGTAELPTTAGDARKPARKPKAPTQQSETCRAAVASARDASTRADWSRVLGSTRDKRCFEDMAEWAELRVWALSETGRLDECVSIGAGSKNAAVRRLARSCEARKGE